MVWFVDIIDNGFLLRDGSFEIFPVLVLNYHQVVEVIIGEFNGVVCDKWPPTRSGGSSPVCLRWVARSSEWENSDVVPGAGDRGFHEWHFPVIWRPR